MPVQNRFLNDRQGNGMFPLPAGRQGSGVISALEQDSGRAGIRSACPPELWREMSHDGVANVAKGICCFPAQVDANRKPNLLNYDTESVTY